MGLKTCSVITLFPEFFRSFSEHSVVGRGLSSGAFSLQCYNPRDWGLGAYKSVDDYSYGGRGGMTLRPEPLAKALEAATKDSGTPFVLYPSPQGVPLTQDLVERLATENHLLFLCGHYEGLDERFVERHVDLEFSIGDYVLTGGELPTMVAIDAIARLLPGVVGNFDSVSGDSFYDGLLDTCHYTRPEVWEGMAVPSVLLSGDDAAVNRWRQDQSLARTLSRRPDLLARAGIGKAIPGPIYLGLVVDEPLDEELTSLLLTLVQNYGLSRLFVAPKSGDKAGQEFLREKLVEHKGVSPKVFKNVAQMVSLVSKKGKPPLVIALEQEEGAAWLEVKREMAMSKGPVLLLLGGSCDGALRLKKQGVIDGALPLVALISTTLDRFFGLRI